MLEVRLNQAHLIEAALSSSNFGNCFVISSPSAQSAPAAKSAASDLLDQSALSTLAERLVAAAERAGADAADAIAVRRVSQGGELREGRADESQGYEGDG